MIEPHRRDVTTGISRRFFLKGAVVTVGGVALGSPWLTACGGSDETTSGNTGASAVALPTFVDALVAKPDLPGTPDGVQPGFISALASYPKSVTGEVGSGSDVTALLMTYNPPPPPPGQNQWLQAVNKAMNVKLTPQVTPAADFAAKFASVTAGNDIPDLVQMPLFLVLPRLPDLLNSRFADLSDHLTGDKVKDYPNLAGIPTYAWKMARVRGRIYGVPLSRPLFAAPLLVRQDLLEKAGLEQPTSLAEFEELCKAGTDPKAGVWALGSDDSFNYDINFFAQLYGAPMRWAKKDDGTLIKEWETEEFAEAVATAAKFRKEGYFHPDSGTVALAKMKDNFGAGKILMHQDGLAGWKAMYDTFGPSTPGFKVDAITPFPATDGGKAVSYLDTGVFSLMGIKKGDENRTKELLRVLNYLAAPFGSEEYLLLTAGVEGVDHTVKDGLPTLTDKGKVESGMSLFYAGSGAQVLNNNDFPAQVEDQHAWETRVVPMGLSDPTNGLYSETNGKVGGALSTAVNDAIRGVISGRNPMSSYADAVKKWRSGGGDAIRKELEAELAKSA